MSPGTFPGINSAPSRDSSCVRNRDVFIYISYLPSTSDSEVHVPQQGGGREEGGQPWFPALNGKGSTQLATASCWSSKTLGRFERPEMERDERHRDAFKKMMGFQEGDKEL